MQSHDLDLEEREPGKPLSRRQFVQRMSIAAAGAGIAGAGLTMLTKSQRAEAAELVVEQAGKLPKIKLGDRLGDMMVARVIICSDWNPALYGPALDMGANFVHKAGYWKSMPPEFVNLDRASYYTDITVDSTPNNPDDEDRAYNQVVSSLDRNGLKYYDIFRAHFGWHSVDAFKNQTGTYKAFQRLKREGKVKYFGVSQHARPENYAPYPEMIQAEIDSGLIDSIQAWYCASTPQEDIDIFAHAHKSGIGMTAMKTYQNGSGKMRRDPDLQKQLGAEGQVGRACVRWALTNTSPITDGKPVFHCCVTALRNMENFEENMGGAGMKTAQRDGIILHV